MILPYRLQLVTREVVFEAVGVPCPRPVRFSHISDYFHDFDPIPDPDVGVSVLLCDVQHTSFLVCATASCSALVYCH